MEPERKRGVYSAPLAPWGRWLRYQYAIFDFSQVREPGTYRVHYRKQLTPPFRISREVYRRGVWEPTLETYLPVQMCHTLVRAENVIWHGACHLDDALQAAAPRNHLDDFNEGPTTDTSYSAHEHIPGLNRGGWHDAGDDDLAAGTQAETTYVLALARREFGADTDRTTVRKDERLVLLHQPDGVPDIVQQVAHGVENLLGGYRAAGHSFCGIIPSTWGLRVTTGTGESPYLSVYLDTQPRVSGPWDLTRASNRGIRTVVFISSRQDTASRRQRTHSRASHLVG